MDWIGSVPFLLVHLVPLAAVFTGVTWFDVGLCYALYAVRMFFVTAGYHRYFAHRSYQLGRVGQFVMAFGAETSAQKGVLWWAGLHRLHHLHADTERDVHSPLRGFWWSHVGWIMARNRRTPAAQMRDFAAYPELRWIDRYHLVPPALLGLAVFLLWGPGALLVGFFLSTVLLFHGTFCINSMAHVFGRRRYATADTSRNSLLLAIITGGEGWHNNHHHYRSSANQGFRWWEVDTTYYVLTLLSVLGIVRGLRRPPAEVLRKNLLRNAGFDAALFRARLIRMQTALDRAKRRGGDYYERKRGEFDAFVGDARRAAGDLARLSAIESASS